MLFPELSCFFNDPTDADNFISGSSAFSKTSLSIWKLMVHILLKTGLENFEHYFTSVWDECNCVVVWAFFGIAFLWGWNENWPFPILWTLLHFQICWHIACSTFTASSFRILNRSTGIPLPPLALIIVMLPKADLTLHFRMSGSRWVITPSWLSGSWRSFLYSSSVYSCHLTLIFFFCYVHTISVLNWPYLWMKYSLDISNFLEEISRLSHSIISLYFFIFFLILFIYVFFIFIYFLILFYF